MTTCCSCHCHASGGTGGTGSGHCSGRVQSLPTRWRSFAAAHVFVNSSFDFHAITFQVEAQMAVLLPVPPAAAAPRHAAVQPEARAGTASAPRVTTGTRRGKPRTGPCQRWALTQSGCRTATASASSTYDQACCQPVCTCVCTNTHTRTTASWPGLARAPWRRRCSRRAAAPPAQ